MEKNRITPEVRCIGCTACSNICGKNAITMTVDKAGFYIAHVNPDKCIECGRCASVCPLYPSESQQENMVLETDYMYNRSREERRKSCSGGVFYALAQKTIQNGGYVCGCVWDENFVARHVCTNDMNVLSKMRGSKYVQSDMGNCFSQIKSLLLDGKNVLFCGTGCQTTGLYNFLGQTTSKNLVCVALICGGVPSPKVWRVYKDNLENKYNSRVHYVDLRKKDRGWLMPELEIKFKNGGIVREVLVHENTYGVCFSEGLIINDACMQCKQKLDNVRADIIIGDDWGITKKRLKASGNEGSSAVICITEKGLSAINTIREEMCVEVGNIADVVNTHHVLTKPHRPCKQREPFFRDYVEKNSGIIKTMESFKESWKIRVGIGFLARMLYKTRIYTPLYNIVWKFRH